MRTVFIALFQGVEAKNILRTSVLTTLLKEDVRIVLLTKSVERAEYYRNEFKNPKLVYEVVSLEAPRGLDILFSRLKFLLLKTVTTDRKRRMAFRDGQGYVKYCVGLVFNWLLARPVVRTFVRFLDIRLVQTHFYEEYFEKYSPDLVFMAHLFDEPEIHLLREARARGVRTVGLINSWDKVTSRAMIRLHPDTFIVFNDFVKVELMKHNDVPADKIFVSGLPQYDYYRGVSDITPRGVFLREIGVPLENQFIVYAPLGSSFSISDWKMIDLLSELNEQEAFGPHISILVRFQPNDFVDPAELQKRPTLLYDYPGKRFSSVRGVDWDMDERDLRKLKDTLYHMSVLVCYASSLSVDAAWFDKPVVNINFELQTPPTFSQSTTQYFESDHYSNALASGGIRLVCSKEDLVSAVRAYVEDPALDHEGRVRLVNEQCVFTDGTSGERIGKFLLSMV